MDTDYPIDKFEINHVPLTSFSLYVQPEAPKGIRDAVDLLVTYMEKSTGYRISVNEDEPAEHEIVIGMTDRDTEAVRSARAQIRYDGYTIVEDGGKLFITGANTAGTAYGVYSFMDKYLGVRFYALDYIYVRENPVVRIEEGHCEVDNPTFEMRDVYWYPVCQSQELANQLKDNSGYNPDMEGGFSYTSNGSGHTICGLAEIPNTTGTQPCLTDEAVFQTVLKNVRYWLQQNPNAKIISVSQNDSFAEQLGCQCANCKAIDDREGTPMGSLLTFVNRIANEIKDEYPNVYVDTLAYRYTRKPPKTIKPTDNVIIRLCSIECCFSHPLSDEGCERNLAFKKDIEDWNAICDNLFVWDYTTNFSYYLSTFPNIQVLRENVRFFADHGVIGLFEQGTYNSASGELAELKAYLLAKLLWNADMTEEEYNTLINEFLQDYYGAGWEHIRSYIDAATEVAQTKHVGIYDHPLYMLTPENLKGKKLMNYTRDLLTLWEKAYEEAETEEQKAHVERSSIQAHYLCLYAGSSGDRTATCKKIYELCQKYGITRHREWEPMPDMSQSENYGSIS